jgi:16S rRNA (guanine1207-N2)-methyltransferase
MTMTVEGVPGRSASLDAADRLLLDEAGARIAGADVVVIGSADLGLSVRELGASSVRVSDDSDVTTEDLDDDLLAGAHLVLVRLPKSLDALDDLARLVATSAAPDVVLLAAGRLKYMSLGMNEVLLRSFDTLDVSLARQKSRVLTARGPRIVAAPTVSRRYEADLDLWIGSVGGVFAGSAVDIGTRAMLAAFDQLPSYDTAIDFGCGTGILAAELARWQPGARVIASDPSAGAVRSARETASANELDIEVVREAGLSGQPSGFADLVVLNPPFHDRGAINTDFALGMFADAARVLRGGGQLWTVFNSSLAYRSALERTVGPTVEITRNAKFTVTASTRSSDTDRLSPSNSAAN